eukprot:3941946-Rhodomonas_salina.6
MPGHGDRARDLLCEAVEFNGQRQHLPRLPLACQCQTGPNAISTTRALLQNLLCQYDCVHAASVPHVAWHPRVPALNSSTLHVPGMA